jgi:general secretion pathway protein L
MPTLILSLPLSPGAAAPEYDYVLTQDDHALQLQGRAPATLLPAQQVRGLQVVAVVPARALSWHRIAPPERVLRTVLGGNPDPVRARSVLAGLLEEQLLDEPERLHFAVFAAEADAGSEARQAWVAACDREWLHASLQALEAAGRTVGRIVAKCTPTQAGTALALLSGELQPAQLLLCTPQGVSLLPLVGASLGLAREQAGLDVFAEPAVMEIAQRSFGNLVHMQTRGQRLLVAAQSPWNLAQLEISASASGRLQKRLAAAWQQLLHGAVWRPVRLGLLALLLVQVVALNAVAWRQHSLQNQQRSAVQELLLQTFPGIGLVVDAPVQMQRAVDELARSRGVGSDADLGRVFAIIGPLAPAGMSLSAIELSGRQLRMDLAGIEAAQAQPLVVALQARGFTARLQDGQLLVTPKEERP